MGMWFEILPSMFIMGALYCGGDALSKLVHFGILGNVSSYILIFQFVHLVIKQDS